MKRTAPLHILCFVWIAFLIPLHAISQSGVSTIRQITMQDGLQTPGVKYIYKDTKGFMWFAFATGINRYDGYSIKRYDEFLPDSCAINSYKYCTSFLETSDGNLWIGTLKNGFARLDRATGEFTYYNQSPSDPGCLGYNTVHCMLQDTAGNIWLGSGGYGLLKFVPASDSFVNIRPAIIHDYPRMGDIYSMLEDRSGNIWAGTGHGIFRLDQNNETFAPLPAKYEIPDKLDKIKCIREDKFGDLWFGTDWGVFRYNPEKEIVKHYITENPDKPNDFAGSYITDIREVNTGSVHQMWICSNSGVLVYDYADDTLGHFKSRKEDPESPFSGGAKSLYFDKQDILWVSSDGLILIDPRENPFYYTTVHSYPDSLYETDASCFYLDRDGMLWVGTSEDGLYQFDQNHNFVANYKPTVLSYNDPKTVVKNRISMVYEDTEGNLWVGTSGEGLSIFDRNNKTFTTELFDSPSGPLEMVWVSDILEDSQGTIWFATQYGLYTANLPLLKDQVLTRVAHPVLSGTSVADLMEDSKGRLWAITHNKGVFCLCPENRGKMLFKQYFHKFYNFEFFATKNVRSIYEDNEGTLWLRSETALFTYNEKSDSIERHEHFNSVFQGENFEFTGDNQGNLWFISQTGLIQYNPKDTSDRSLKTFGNSEGFYFDVIVHTSFIKNHCGQLYIGGGGLTGRGFCRFHPDSVHGDNLHLPPVVLTDFKIRNEDAGLDSIITYKKHIKLKYNQNFFSFEFAALDYRDPSKNQYAFILEGLDDSWTYSGSRRFANYTDIPPGKYIFRVKGCNNDGYWNEQGASILLSITPPPWKTWWAYSLYALFLLGLIFSWRKYDLHRQDLKHSLEIEHIESEKLKDLDRMKSRFFANISHEFRTPLTLILGPIEKLSSRITDRESKHDLNIMQRNARRLQQLINQLLSLSILESGKMRLQIREENIVFLVRGYVQSFESLAKQKGIELFFHCTEENIQLFVDRDKIEKILYNLLSNAFKFTAAGGKIVVSVADGGLCKSETPEYQKQSENWVEIAVSDTGMGIPRKKLEHIFERFYQADDTSVRSHEGTGIGLALVRELVDLHHGHIHVESEERKGTVFTIHLPAGKEHFRDEELSHRKIDSLLDNSSEDLLKTSAADTGSAYHTATAELPEIPDYPPSEESTLPEDKPLILIVEDNADLRHFIRGYLVANYRIHEAEDGITGLEKAIEAIPDIVLSDVMMPGMDGYQLCHQLKTDERTSHIPVIILTAKAGMSDRIEGLEKGADDFLVKPFEPRELMVRIKNLIENRNILRARLLKEINPLFKEHTDDYMSIDRVFLQKVKKIIEENLADPDFNTQSLAEMMAMSRSQCYRKLRALTNFSPNELIRFTRLHKAAELLSNTSVNVAAVAYDVGFNNPSYFAECFKKQFGILPSGFGRKT